jgi:hypothetical protein
VPSASSLLLEKYIASVDYTVHFFPVGHIGMYVSGKVQKDLPLTIGTFNYWKFVKDANVKVTSSIDCYSFFEKSLVIYQIDTPKSPLLREINKCLKSQPETFKNLLYLVKRQGKPYRWYWFSSSQSNLHSY